LIVLVVRPEDRGAACPVLLLVLVAPSALILFVALSPE
jgi:hypothetical protein